LILTALIVIALVFLKYAVHPCTVTGKVSVDNVIEHLQKLNEFGLVHGNRAANTSGYEASVQYIMQVLGRTNFEISIQKFTYPSFQVIGTSTMKILPLDISLNYGTDFMALQGSASGTFLSSSLYLVGLGCTDQDYAGFDHSIALIQRGTCTFQDKLNLAQAYNASGIVIYDITGNAFNARLSNAVIPCFSVAAWAGKLLSTGEYDIDFAVETSSTILETSNVLATTLGGSSNYTIVVGSHLDSVPAGPGVNDNGSGSSTVLELALSTYFCMKEPVNKITFAFWGAEELGLLGSTYYVSKLTTEQKANIALNLNFDMLGSPNFVFGIYNGSGADESIRVKSEQIQTQFEKYFKETNTSYILTPFTGRSDYGPFINAGIPAGGLATGAEGLKTEDERIIFGGFANAQYDPCYHQKCDTFQNINTHAIEVNLHAAAAVLQYYGENENIATEVSNKKQLLENNLHIKPLIGDCDQ